MPELSSQAKDVIQLARQECQRFGGQEITVEQLLLGIVKHGKSDASRLLLESGIDIGKVRRLFDPPPEQLVHYRRNSKCRILSGVDAFFTIYPDEVFPDDPVIVPAKDE